MHYTRIFIYIYNQIFIIEGTNDKKLLNALLKAQKYESFFQWCLWKN